jgi:hypothetical protein
MRRTFWLASFAGAAGLAMLSALVLAAWTSADPVKEDKPLAAAASRSAPLLPITGCALFSSGVGYFQREGEIDGNARVDLTFPVSDINDLLKSMVLQDLGNGHIDAVSYDSHDPIDKTLKSFAVNLQDNPSFGQILNQARGEKVEIVQQQAANQPGTLTGTVVGVEKQKQPAGKDAIIETEVLNLWCAEGLRSVKLPEIQRMRFLNPVMESEFRRALEVLALSHDTQKKAVSLSFTGDGKRPVRVGYVIENPIWKTSYRLTVDKEGKVYLQGWAVVENPTDEDWKDVRMALISGRPISFQMDLYQPLYVPRPTVVPELFASLQPRTYSGAMDDHKRPTESPPVDMPAKKRIEDADQKEEKPRESPQIIRGFIRGGGGVPERKLDLKEGVNSAASAAQLGDYFEYRIDHPVNLPRQKSALLPIVTKDVEGAKVSIYNEATHAKFPLLGLKFKNTSGLHLMQGPITVFENNTYAGDSRILDLQPGEERLLSYAIDLGTEAEAIPQEGNGKLTKVELLKGILTTTTKLHEGKTYKFRNRSDQDRLLVVEHPYRPDFTLLCKEKPSERARDVYRFELKIPAGKTAELGIVEERDLVQTVRLTNSDDQTMQLFLTSPASTPEVKTAVQKAVELKGAWMKTAQELAKAEKQLKDIVDDQARLRANLKEMPKDAVAYKRYLDKLDKQETEIDDLQKSIKTLQDAEHRQRQTFEAYLESLGVERRDNLPV